MERIVNGKKYMFFYNGIFSNWYKSNFEVNSIKYNCGEQYMMYQKAMTFNDKETADKILYEYSPKKQKQLGREVRNFNHKQWDLVKYEIVKTGLEEKFNCNSELMRHLLKYKDFQFVEASPYDRIWGIGFAENDAIQNIQNWGENLLGKILTEIAIEMY